MPVSKINNAAAEIEKFYGFDVKILGQYKLPEAAYCSIRKRYIAKIILNYLASLEIPGSAGKNYKVIALTNKDIETEDGDTHWGVMGLAFLGGDVSIVSTFRMNSKRSRLQKVILHETGHMMNIDHCSSKDQKCFMKDAKGKGATIDQTKKHLCKDCKLKLIFI
ncbi:hypothetical protein [Rufibacter quisquiliarum]|uniref:Putative Zn-dependent protease n=1 Tax=Rufibacter quisquiliarum TaxID=1549639 RepID=A0A839GHX0_9BACT|nr:hypothetical protein [Rufibacter quisquiliarum]MBA9078210.1 putative Zn-dependent protease [Rufibacter quisquiliarum]